MKTVILPKYNAIAIIVLFLLLINPKINAQTDVIDLISASPSSNCSASPLWMATINMDGIGEDTIVILENIRGYRYLTGSTDKKYEFAANNGSIDHFFPCSDEDSDCEFLIRFESPLGTSIGVNNISFQIENPLTVTLQVKSFPGDNSIDPSGTFYQYCNVTKCDTIKINAADDIALNDLSELLKLDNLNINFPKVTGVSDNSRCGSGTVDLLAAASGGTIKWYANPTGGSSLHSGAAFTSPVISTTTSYWVDLTDNSCTSSFRTEVIAAINPNPTASISPDPAEVCVGIDLALNGNPAGGSSIYSSHSWTGPGATLLNNINTVNPTFNSPTDGTFDLTYTVTDDKGCIGSDIISVTVYPNPTASISPDPAEVCAGIDLNLNGNPAGGSTIYSSHSWTGPGATLLNNINTVNPTFNSPTDGTFDLTYTVTDDKGCIGSDVISVTVNTNPTASISPDPAEVCVGIDLALNGNPAGGSSIYSSHSWTGPGATLLNNINTVNPTFNSPTDGTFDLTYTVTDDKGCIGSDIISVTVYPNPTASISPDPAEVCAGIDLNLNGNPAGGSTIYSSHSWTGPGATLLNNINTVNPTFNSPTDGTFDLTYTVTDNKGCIGSDVRSVTVYPNPTASISPDPAEVCAGIDLNLNGNPAGGSTIYSSHSWTGPGATLLNNINTVNPTFNSPTDGTFDLSYTVTDNKGCIGSDVRSVTVYPNPTASISPDPAEVCAGIDLNLNGNPAGGSSIYSSHSWTGPGATLLNNQNSVNPTFNSANDGAFNLTYTVTDNKGCIGSDVRSVTVYPNPTASISPDPAEVCVGIDLALNGNPAGGSTIYSSHSWTGSGATLLNNINSVNPTFNSANDGAFNLTYTVTDNKGCIGSDVRSVTVHPLPTIDAFANPEIICPGDPCALNANGGLNYSWNNGLGTGSSKNVNPTNETTYTVIGTDANNCPNSASVTVKVKVEPTDITLTHLTLDENSKYTGKLSTVDNDIDDSHSYILVETSLYPDNTFFEIDGDLLSSTVDLNYENKASYTIKIRSTDECDLFKDKVFTIDVNDIDPEVVCVIDLSGSMNWSYDGDRTVPLNQQRLTLVKKALKTFTSIYHENFVEDGNYALVGFKASYNYLDEEFIDDSYVIFNMSELNNGNYQTIMNDANGIIAELEAGGNTPLLGGIETAIDLFQSNKERVMIVLSDGQHNCPNRINDDNDDVTELIELLNENEIKLYTIGFGQPYEVDEDLLSTLAYVNPETGIDGYYDVVEDAGLTAGMSADDWTPLTALSNAWAKIFTEGFNFGETIDPLGEITKGQKLSFDIPVTIFENKLCFVVSWTKEQLNHIGTKIYTSNGQLLPQNHPGIKYEYHKYHTIITISNKFLNNDGIVGDEPWKLELDGTSIIGDKENYQYLVLNKSKNLQLISRFDKSLYYTGDKMKIYVELFADNSRLTHLDKVDIKATRPSEGLGNWQAKIQISKAKIASFKNLQLAEIKRFSRDQAHKLQLDSLQTENIVNRNISNYQDNISSSLLKSQIAINDLKIKYPSRILINGLNFNDEGNKGDETALDGIYTAEYNKLTKEGTYIFNLSIQDESNGKNIIRETQLQKYVRVKIKPSRFIKEIVSLDTMLKGKQVYHVVLQLRDKQGNIPSSYALKNIQLELSNGELINHIQTEADGSFTQLIAIPEGVKPKEIMLKMKVYDQIGEQRLQPIFPKWYYIIFILILFILTILRNRRP